VSWDLLCRILSCFNGTVSRDFTHESGSTGKEEEEDPGSGGEGFPSQSAVVVSQCLLLDFVISHISTAMCKGVVANVVV
jgi:hypothetical protein